MSTTVTNTFRKRYQRQMRKVYQRKGLQLRRFVDVRNAEQGDSLQFDFLGKGTATQKTRHGDLVPANISHSNVTIQVEDWYAVEYVDSLDKIKTEVDLENGYMAALAETLGRKHDDLIVDNWAAAGLATITAGSLNNAQILAVLEALRDNDVMTEDLFFVISNQQYTNIMNSSPAYQFIGSRDYTQANTGQTDNAPITFRAHGFDFLVYNGLPYDAVTNTRKCFAGSKSATGMAIAKDISVKIERVAHKDAYVINANMSLGVGVLQSTGIIEVDVTE